MRAFILSNVNVLKKLIPKLETFLDSTRYICYIWSFTGLFQVENDRIYSIKIKDVLAKKTLLGAYPVTIDESEFVRQEESFQIAPRSHKDYTTLKTYRLSKESTVEFVLEYKDHELYDNYFLLPKGSDIHSQKIKAEILEFLNL